MAWQATRRTVPRIRTNVAWNIPIPLILQDFLVESRIHRLRDGAGPGWDLRLSLSQVLNNVFTEDQVGVDLNEIII